MLGKSTIAVAVLALCALDASAEPAACPVQLSLDSSHAVLLADAFADDKLTGAEIHRFLDHPRTSDVIRKTRSFGLDVTRDDLEQQLQMLAAGKTITDRSFGLGRYRDRYASTAALLASLEDTLPTLMASICDRLAPYVPAGKHYTQSVVVVSAVNSTGFTFENPAEIFLVAEAFRGDEGGLSDLVVHESYHAIQSALTAGEAAWSEKPGGPAEVAMRLLADTVFEGTATHVADPIVAGKEGALREFQYRSARRYRRDMRGMFVLFDTTLYRAFHDPRADYEELVGIGLQGNEGFYHLGALMAKTIAETDGAAAIPAHFERSPLAFFERYIEISSADTARYPQFSASTLSILKQLGEQY